MDICERLALTDLVAVQAFHGRGESHFANGEPAAAIVSFSRSLELARAIGDKSYESENLLMVGWACTGHMGLADYPRALSHFDSALAIARAADLQWHLGPTLIGRSHVRIALGRFAEAWADLNEALSRLETLGLLRYQMMAHDALGCLFLDLNLPDQAAVHFDRGLQLARDAGIRYWLPRLQANLVIAQLRLGVSGDRAMLQAARQYAQEHSEGWLTLGCLEALAELALFEGDARGGVKHARQLLAQASHGNMRELIGRAHCLLGRAWLASMAYEAARKDLLKALGEFQAIGQIPLAWTCHRALARVAAALGDAGAEDHQRACADEIAARITLNLQGSGLTFNLTALQ